MPSNDTFYMYHREYAPAGKMFDMEVDGTPMPEELVRAGWADNPAKLGIKVGADTDESVAAVKALMDSGRLSMYDDGDGRAAAREAAIAEAEAEKARHIEAMEAMRQPTDEFKEHVERDADLKADARRQHPKAYKDQPAQPASGKSEDL